MRQSEDTTVNNDGAREESLRMVSSQPLDSEPVSDEELRPHVLEGFIGQPRLKRMILYHFLLLFLHQIHHYWQVIAVAVKPSAACLGTQRSTLVLTFLLDEVIAAEDVVLPELQRTVVLVLTILVQEIRRDDNLIEEIP